MTALFLVLAWWLFRAFILFVLLALVVLAIVMLDAGEDES